MSLVNVINLSLAFLGKELFREAGFQVEPGDRVGLVGPNGSGKTTLLRLLMGEMTPDSGEIRVTGGTRAGYLAQDVQDRLSGPLLQSVLDFIPGRVALREEIAKVEELLKNDPKESLAARLAEIHQEMNDLDTAFPSHRAEKILEGLGFRSEDFEMPVSSLSGGWKMRAALASLLYQNPDLLLLDEPTNHLDIPSVRWLEGFLEDYKGALILVSHDRDFLNRQIERVISFEPEGMRCYSGNYDFYLKAREDERSALEAKARNQEQKIKEARKFIERFKAKATKARQAQSKIKLVKKMEMVQTLRKEKPIRFSFSQVSRSGRVVVNIQDVSKAFGEKRLYENLNLTVLRGERVAIIGPNGSGKTTLLRMVSEEIEPDHGRISLGHGVSLSSYAQHHSEMLNPGKTIIEEVYQVVPHETVGFVRGICGAFLFSGEDVDKAIGILSGGERARVCLAKILVKPGNFLVMDEPTNHLDLVSSEILINALGDFNGTLLFVSHNQSFVNGLATKIWDIKGGDIVEYPGKLYEYYSHQTGRDQGPHSGETLGKEGEKISLGGTLPENRQSRKIVRREKAEKRRQITETLRPIQDAVSKLEDRVAGLERRKGELEKTLADPETIKDKDKYLRLLNEYGTVKKKVEELMLRWEYKQDELESAQRELG